MKKEKAEEIARALHELNYVRDRLEWFLDTDPIKIELPVLLSGFEGIEEISDRHEREMKDEIKKYFDNQLKEVEHKLEQL